MVKLSHIIIVGLRGEDDRRLNLNTSHRIHRNRMHFSCMQCVYRNAAANDRWEMERIRHVYRMKTEDTHSVEKHIPSNSRESSAGNKSHLLQASTSVQRRLHLIS